MVKDKKISKIELEDGIGENIQIEESEVEEADDEQIVGLAADEEEEGEDI